MNTVYINGPDGTYSSSISEYTSYPDDELMREYEKIINDLELDGFWAKYEEDLQRLIVNNTTNDNFTISVGSTSAGSPGISPKFSEAPDELIPQGKLYFGREGDNLATGGEIRMFIRETDRVIEDMMDHMNNLGSIQRSLTNRIDVVSSAIISNSAAKSSILDADFAREQSRYIRMQILQQTTSSSLAQANMSPQAVLGFLR